MPLKSSCRVSIIIPARNEELFLQETIQSYRQQQYKPLEIIVVVNNSTDKTFHIAKQFADTVLHFPDKIGVSRARNEGARIALGDIFVFSDADTRTSQGAIAQIAHVVEKNTIGILLGKPLEKGWRGKPFFFYKNMGHRLGFFKSAIFGVIFCHRDIFFKIKGFDESRKIAEHADFIKRALLKGAKYRLVTKYYAITSLRRFQRLGFLKEYLFWLNWRVASWFGKGKKLEENYFDN